MVDTVRLFSWVLGIRRLNQTPYHHHHHHHHHHHPDIVRRHILSQVIFKSLKAELLRNPHFAFVKKKMLVSSMVDNKLLAGAGVWSLRTGPELRAFEASYYGHWRQCCMPLLGVTSAGMTDEQICVILRIGLAREIIYAARVRMLIQSIQERLLFLMILLAFDTWWMCAQFADSCSLKTCLRCPVKQSTQKVNAFHNSGGAEKLGLHRLSAHTCNECGQNFSNAGALGSHRSKVHRIVAVSTALAQGSVCHVCMKDFHDTKWLQRHLNSGTVRPRTTAW